MSQEEPITDDRPTDDTQSDTRESNQRRSTETSVADLERDDLATLVGDLQAENRRLREEYARAKRGEYRRSALALLTLGMAAVVGGLLLPVARDILFILGATGLFGGALTWYLTPERLLTATVGRSSYESVAAVGAELREELGLEETNVYVPVPEGDVSGASVRLFVPQSAGYELPGDDSLSSLFVLPESADERGVSLRPTAARLVREFDESAGSIAAEPVPLAEQLVDALVEQFELADEADFEVDTESRQFSARVESDVYGAPTEFDHPVPSFLGTGMAFGLDRSVTVETTETENGSLVTCRW